VNVSSATSSPDNGPLNGCVRVLREPQVRPANVAINWTPKDGKRSRGRPRKTWHMTFGDDLQGMGVTWTGAKRVHSDRQRDGGILLPDVLTTTGGSRKSKYVLATS